MTIVTRWKEVWPEYDAWLLADGIARHVTADDPGTAAMRAKLQEIVEKHTHALAPASAPVRRVHFLVAGVAPCGAGMPLDWPEGHKWSGNRGEVTCAGCIEAMKVFP